MSDVTPYGRYEAASGGRAAPSGYHPASLADVLDRVLDKGLVIAGDISISLVSVELLTIKIRLLIASADKAREMGIDWWTRDEDLTGARARALEARARGEEGELDPEELLQENRALLRRIDELENSLRGLLAKPGSVAARPTPISTADLMKPEKTSGRRLTTTEADALRHERGGDEEREHDADADEQDADAGDGEDDEG